MTTIEKISLWIAFIALMVAFWQWFLSKQQLDQAKETKSDTEKLLAEIKEKVLKIENLTDETRKDLKDQVSKLIDKQDENMKMLLNAPKEENQNQLIVSLLPVLMQNPEMMQKMMELWKKQ